MLVVCTEELGDDGLVDEHIIALIVLVCVVAISVQVQILPATSNSNDEGVEASCASHGAACGTVRE